MCLKGVNKELIPDVEHLHCLIYLFTMYYISQVTYGANLSWTAPENGKKDMHTFPEEVKIT